MRVFNALILAIFLPAFTQAAPPCPLGTWAKDHLTIQQVMVNFGKYYGQVASLTLQAKQGETVSETQIQSAIDSLGVAQACAQAVLDHPEGDLLPGHAMMLQGQARQDYIDDFTGFMSDFRDGLQGLKNDFITLKSTPAAQRDWMKIAKECDDVGELANHAHGKLAMRPQTIAFFAPLHGMTLIANEASTSSAGVIPVDAVQAAGGLKDNMKTASRALKAIQASMTDASKNADNANQAEVGANAFRAVMNDVPDAINDMPAGQRAAAIADYQSMIQQTVDLFEQLKTAFQNNDNAGAQALVQKLLDIKRDGHGKYNP